MAKRDITYINKDFDGFRAELQEYLQKYFPSTFNDYNDTSAGTALLETVAYVGDVLSFYLDRQFQELFLGSAIEKTNVIKLAEMLGYFPRGKTAAIGSVTLNVVVPSTINFSTDATIPTSGESLSAYLDARLSPKVKSGTIFLASNSATTPFELLEDVDFNSSTSRVLQQISDTEIGIYKSINKVSSGLTKTFDYNVGLAQKFLEVSLPDTDVLEIISVIDSTGSEWQQVDYLAQSNAFIGKPNLDASTSADTGFIMRMKPVPKRFIKRRTKDNFVKLVFGSGTKTLEDTEFIPAPEDFVLPQTVRGSLSGEVPSSLDPADLLETKTLGVAPEAVTLKITYRIGGGLGSNVASGSINKLFKKFINFPSSQSDILATQDIIVDSLGVVNSEPTTGGDNAETLDEMRHNASAFFAAQNRIVTKEDYAIRVLTMPPEYGSIFRIQAQRSPYNNTVLQLMVLSRNDSGQLTQANTALKNNLITYLDSFRIANDIIEVVDGTILNMGVHFVITTHVGFNRTIVLGNALIAVKNLMNIKNFNFQTNIILSEVQNAVHDVLGVRSVVEVIVKNITGSGYSPVAFDIVQNTRKGEIVCPDDSVFEVKNPDLDISGVIM